MESIENLCASYKHFIIYSIFGLLTTVINLAVYFFCYNIIEIANVLSVVIAWIVAVAFAFITNKLWVFNSTSFSVKTITHEVPAFFGARLITGILDVMTMYVVVDILTWNSTVWKLISNVIVVVLNYVASKYVVFNKKKRPN